MSIVVDSGMAIGQLEEVYVDAAAIAAEGL